MIGFTGEGKCAPGSCPGLMDGIACSALWMRHPELGKDLARSGYAFALSWQRAQDASGLKSFSMTPGMVDLSMRSATKIHSLKHASGALSKSRPSHTCRFARDQKKAGSARILFECSEPGSAGCHIARLEFHFAERESSLVLVVKVAVLPGLSKHGLRGAFRPSALFPDAARALAFANSASKRACRFAALPGKANGAFRRLVRVVNPALFQHDQGQERLGHSLVVQELFFFKLRQSGSDQAFRFRVVILLQRDIGELSLAHSAC